ncbi:MAG: NfeD family protein [Rhodoblastus sp.]|nr:NfeD family protein [Rhodoblastus sp.]MCC0000697.1 NfeD family protein [Methylobacteriaceae bacterium]MCC0002841.1 NfeD family protein [Methylobacteriaceae bacterium]
MPVVFYAPFAWMVFGLALCGAEIFIPGAFLLWIGFAAITLGLIELLVAIPFEWSLLIFAALAVAFSLVGRKVYGGLTTGGETGLNSRAAALVGREFTLIEPIVSGEGKAKVLDTVWRVTGADAPAGSRVRVTGVAAQGAVLKVEPV